MSMAAIAEHPNTGHWRNWLNDDDAVKNEVPKGTSGTAAGRKQQRRLFPWMRLLNYARQKCQYSNVLFEASRAIF